MKKVTLTIAALAALTFGAYAQAPSASSTPVSASATSQVQVNISNAIDISFVQGGGTTAIPFTTTDDFQNGVESSASTLRVRSNRLFRVDVKTGGGFMIKNGNPSSMPTSVLGVEVTANNTGGTVINGNGSYSPLSAASMQLIGGGLNGGNQNFSVQYKATPGYAYEAGSYGTDVIYTATQQ